MLYEVITRMKFSVYGGLQSCSHQDVKRANMDGNYDSGTLLVSKTFGNDAQYNKKWYVITSYSIHYTKLYDTHS